MANLIDRDDAAMDIRALAKDIARYNGGVDAITVALKEAYDMVNAAPTIDAVPVVRCAECIHHARPLFTSNTHVWCPLLEHHRPLDWFCADGRREK